MRVDPYKIRQLLIKRYAQMSALTEPECTHSCRCPHSCCSSEYCQLAEEWARDKWNTILRHTKHPRLPFMGSNGCIIPPHLRPICTLHTCAINSLGFKPNDKEWTNKYFRLRNIIETAEFLLEEINEPS